MLSPYTTSPEAMELARLVTENSAALETAVDMAVEFVLKEAKDNRSELNKAIAAGKRFTKKLVADNGKTMENSVGPVLAEVAGSVTENQIQLDMAQRRALLGDDESGRQTNALASPPAHAPVRPAGTAGNHLRPKSDSSRSAGGGRSGPGRNAPGVGSQPGGSTGIIGGDGLGDGLVGGMGDGDGIIVSSGDEPPSVGEGIVVSDDPGFQCPPGQAVWPEFDIVLFAGQALPADYCRQSGDGNSLHVSCPHLCFMTPDSWQIWLGWINQKGTVTNLVQHCKEACLEIGTGGGTPCTPDQCPEGMLDVTLNFLCQYEDIVLNMIAGKCQVGTTEKTGDACKLECSGLAYADYLVLLAQARDLVQVTPSCQASCPTDGNGGGIDNIVVISDDDDIEPIGDDTNGDDDKCCPQVTCPAPVVKVEVKPIVPCPDPPDVIVNNYITTGGGDGEPPPPDKPKKPCTFEYDPEVNATFWFDDCSQEIREKAANYLKIPGFAGPASLWSLAKNRYVAAEPTRFP